MNNSIKLSVLGWMNILDFDLNWILNRIIKRPDSMKKCFSKKIAHPYSRASGSKASGLSSLSGPFKVYLSQQLTTLLNNWLNLPLLIRVLNPTLMNMFGIMQKMQDMQNIQELQNIQDMQNVQNMQNTQNMQNMQNIQNMQCQICWIWWICKSNDLSR